MALQTVNKICPCCKSTLLYDPDTFIYYCSQDWSQTTRCDYSLTATEVVNTFRQALTQGQRERETLQAENSALRELLWIRHGCNLPYLYGDDGERTCNKCLIDFVRDTPEQIKDRWMIINKPEIAIAVKHMAKKAAGLPTETVIDLTKQLGIMFPAPDVRKWCCTCGHFVERNTKICPECGLKLIWKWLKIEKGKE